MTLTDYINSINQRYKLGNATEHTFRGDLQNLIEALHPKVRATNEPKRQKCGAPDYILTHKDIPIGFIEAKDIGDNDLDGLKKSGNKEQFDRYKASLENIIFTDYLSFHWYKDGELTMQVSIAKVFGNKIIPIKENFNQFEMLLEQFCNFEGRTITSAKKLAEMMAGKARLLADVIAKSLDTDEANEEDSSLKYQFLGFQQVLIKDITNRQFADVYAQTIAYGMFAARTYDTDLETFSRQEAAERIPKSNPFLRRLFSYIAGIDIDDRIVWIVDSLADVFRACDVRKILDSYGKATKMEDPIIHFYETFLAEYDPKLRKARGVWYTPQPVVNFIIRSIDEILKTEFDLPMGLADNSMVKIKTRAQTADKRSKTGFTEVEKEVHKVQILDPATGTGTFLVEFIKEINKSFEGQEGLWNDYVEKHLIPRLNGFELLMASYAMAHLKLDLLLKETGYKATKNQRLKVFLTNSLEEPKTEEVNLFMAQWLSQEAIEANIVKKETPVMVVAGNPPYNIVSNNLSDKQRALVEKYKYINGKKIKEKGALQLEKNLNDDYVKFIALAESFIKKNNQGIIAFINNNNFLDAFTLRGMRYQLQNTFDLIYVIDAHGNYMKKEISPDGEKDENIFDIQQGVSINIFVKTNKKKENELGKVFHHDLFGRREKKYQFLLQNSLYSIPFKLIDINQEQFYFVKKDFVKLNDYQKGFAIDKLFFENVTGVKTHRDGLVIGYDKDEIKEKILTFYDEKIPLNIVKKNLGLKDTGTWDSQKARKNGTFDLHFFEKIQYRPFDTLDIYYDSNLIDCNRINVMKHFIGLNENIGLVIPRQAITDNWSHVQITSTMIDNRVHYSNKGTPICCPLYLYPETDAQHNTSNLFESAIATPSDRKPNLNEAIVNEIAEKLGLQFTPEKTDKVNTFAPIDILDYIYAVLHSPTYREKYKEFLKIDFPRVPYPKDKATFWQLVKLGGGIRQLHLLESSTLQKYITTYPIAGSNEITRKMTKSSIGFELTDKANQLGKVWINDEQYFDKVPLIAWEFYIGGYQPAQKWLKDRTGRLLGFDDIIHYQKMIVALTETDRLMKEIDKIEIE